MKTFITALTLTLCSPFAMAENLNTLLASYENSTVNCSGENVAMSDLLKQPLGQPWLAQSSVSVTAGEYMLSFELTQDQTAIEDGVEGIYCSHVLGASNWRDAVMNKLATRAQIMVTCGTDEISVGELIRKADGDLYSRRDGMFAYDYVLPAGDVALEFRTISNHGFFLPEDSLRCLTK